jgi:hypothetical protein
LRSSAFFARGVEPTKIDLFNKVAVSHSGKNGEARVSIGFEFYKSRPV